MSGGRTGFGRLPNELELAVFRILQEALTDRATSKVRSNLHVTEAMRKTNVTKRTECGHLRPARRHCGAEAPGQTGAGQDQGLHRDLRRSRCRGLACASAARADRSERNSMSPQFIDRTGIKYGRLKVCWPSGRSSRPGNPPRIVWLCVCDCGAVVTVLGSSLAIGNTKSCGYLSRELAAMRLAHQATRHGEARNGRESPEYRSWRGMIQRCEQPSYTGFRYYGGRGISVCERWHTYENFLADMGRKPTAKHSIDRWPNNDGNYEPGNVRWATR